MIIPKNFPKNNKIIYCVLNWGLGHATRSFVIIDQLLSHGNTISLASDGEAGILLKKKYPSLPYYELPSYNVNYKYTSTLLNFAANAPRVYRAVSTESDKIFSLHTDHGFDLVISDNRPGCRLTNLPSIFISHQLVPYHPNKILAWIFKKLNHYYVSKFDAIWAPDYSSHRLSGTLTKAYAPQSRIEYLGPISNFINQEQEKKYLTILLSGPEPQRSLLEKKLHDLIKERKNENIIFIRGTQSPNLLAKQNHITYYDLILPLEVNKILNQTSILISRSGYTTLMDIEQLHIPKVILVPTPGQSEQEYLGHLHSDRYTVVSQHMLKEESLIL